MPIRPENKDRYPANWPQISLEVRQRAGWKCEECGVPDGQLGGRLPSGLWCPAARWDHPADRPVSGIEGWCDGPAAFPIESFQIRLRIVQIVLTVAHMDHQPENCDRANLKALCQRCHNLYDAPHRRAGIVERARKALGIDDLLERCGL